MDIKKGAMSSILQSELDWELASFRENVDAIRMSTEELIKDVRGVAVCCHLLQCVDAIHVQ